MAPRAEAANLTLVEKDFPEIIYLINCQNFEVVKVWSNYVDNVTGFILRDFSRPVKQHL